MALINCRECRKEISNEAATCPNCGCSVPDKSKKDLHYLFSVWFFVFFFSWHHNYLPDSIMPFFDFLFGEVLLKPLGKVLAFLYN